MSDAASAGTASAGTERPTVRVETDGPVATIVLDRPDALNALTIPLKRELLRALRDVERDRSIRAVVLTGAGRAFCAGQDLRERLEPGAAPLDVEIRERYAPLVRQLVAMPKPVVAAVNGVAAGAGASLAFACDLRVAADDARFVLAFGRIGLVPDSGATWLLPRLVGLGRATELALLPDPIGAEEALRIGLVNRVVPADRLLAEAQELAGRLAEAAPRAVALTKRALAHGLESGLDAALEYEAALQGVAGRTADHAEGIAAFVEKRPPRFTGE
jgi:2-(1,2-epoxy-1,2-dihydrophenyl)acetyl-CoA isomerase